MPINHALAGLKPIRQYKRVPIQPLADLIGVSYNSYCRYENGSRRIFFDQVVLLAEALGVSTHDLIVWRSEEELLKLLGPSSAQLAPQVPPPPTEPSGIVVSAPGAIDDLAAELGEWKL